MEGQAVARALNTERGEGGITIDCTGNEGRSSTRQRELAVVCHCGLSESEEIETIGCSIAYERPLRTVRAGQDCREARPCPGDRREWHGYAPGNTGIIEETEAGIHSPEGDRACSPPCGASTGTAEGNTAIDRYGLGLLAYQRRGRQAHREEC